MADTVFVASNVQDQIKWKAVLSTGVLNGVPVTGRIVLHDVTGKLAAEWINGVLWISNGTLNGVDPLP